MTIIFSGWVPQKRGTLEPSVQGSPGTDWALEVEKVEGRCLRINATPATAFPGLVRFRVAKRSSNFRLTEAPPPSRRQVTRYADFRQCGANH